jgi:DNA-binding FadR family transcriptional regulator
MGDFRGASDNIGNEESVSGPVNLGSPVERTHASDQVFKELASAILNRELAAGSALPPERELSERFSVSRIVVREAVHRLKEYELVRVRQGSPTIVLDPERSTDIRLLGLEIELLEHSPEGMRIITERQVYAAAALLDLAEQRMTTEELDALERIIDGYLATPDREAQAQWLAFERAYWTAIATGTKNRVYLRETLWFFNLLERDPRFLTAMDRGPLEPGLGYKALLVAQRARSGSAALYLRALRRFATGLTSAATEKAAT